MTANELKNDPVYGVVLTDGQGVSIVEIKPDEEVFDCARRVIGCEWIEIVEPDALAKKDCVLLIDEEAKLKESPFVNCVASYLYESQRHGDMIVGDAVIVKSSGEALKMLTGDEARELAVEMMSLREKAIRQISSALGLSPVPMSKHTDSISTELRQSAEKNRQPCKNDPLER